eukprot:TRINITY_DN30450_c0_g1_i3.p3 TRINITY_DN30450_c0_g1~~TRINITY_DN30450_c0_g1_i3.p3  ORF type:complete len:111 (-),score=43.08 TRINITY_DN30450_c0_g1_i3:8-340(-)
MFCGFFFFKQKTAYEMQRGLVGSEMCIRDRVVPAHILNKIIGRNGERISGCLLYTSDAADDTPCVDLGGRRSIKKKKNTIKQRRCSGQKNTIKKRKTKHTRQIIQDAKKK